MAINDQEMIQKDRAERRYLPRWETRIRAFWMKDTSHQAREGSIKNLSCAGACFCGDTVFSPNEVVHLTIDLPWESPIRVCGVVRWVDEGNGQKLAGIRFVNVDNMVCDAILHHMKEAEHVNLAEIWFKDWK
ncbi:MAG: PilZ domain-containing protein [Candidatus Omnitrophica bacterium]|nr:PilZ domain-containing protein [Candidatus Omnitrophota bacterium]